MRAKLTDTFLKKTWKEHRPATDRIFIWDTEMESFGVQIMASGDRTFVCHYRPVVNGTRIKDSRRMTLGGAMDAAGLAQAKNEARVIFGRLSGALATGQSCDPLRERKATKERNRVAR